MIGSRSGQNASDSYMIAITLRHVVTLESYVSIHFAFRQGSSTITLIVPEVCDAIIRYYLDEAVICPTCPDNWLEIGRGGTYPMFFVP